VKLLQRLARLDKPTRIFYISDFDPAGDCMPVAVARQVEFWRTRYAPATDIKLTPLALTRAQVEHYDLPRTPLKDGEKRADGFRQRHGGDAVELDALEALRPGTLAQLVRAALAPYRDRSLRKRLEDAEAEARVVLQDEWHDATETVQNRLAEIKGEVRPVLDRYTDRLKALDDELQAELEPYHEQIKKLRAELDTIADAFDPELPERPEPEIDEPDEADWLFDSDRDYLTQLEHYHAHQQGVPLDDDSGAA
jgi:hypothetical protein